MTAHEELAKHPQIVEAKRLEEEASKAYAKASAALQDHHVQQHNRRWWQVTGTPTSVFVEAEQRAKDAYWAARHSRERLEKDDPAIKQEISSRIEQRNLPMAEHQERIKTWRERVDVVEQMQKKLGRAVRWASEADKGVKLEVVASGKFGVLLRGDQETHGVVLKAPDGGLVLTSASVYGVREFKVGMQVQLEHRLHGLTLTSGRGRGLSR